MTNQEVLAFVYKTLTGNPELVQRFGDRIYPMVQKDDDGNSLIYRVKESKAVVGIDVNFTFTSTIELLSSGKDYRLALAGLDMAVMTLTSVMGVSLLLQDDGYDPKVKITYATATLQIPHSVVV